MNDLDIWAFPSHGSMGEVVQEGMTLRDYFAAKAMRGFIGIAPVGTEFGSDHPETNLTYAHASYAMADAMLAARSAT